MLPQILPPASVPGAYPEKHGQPTTAGTRRLDPSIASAVGPARGGKEGQTSPSTRLSSSVLPLPGLHAAVEVSRLSCSARRGAGEAKVDS